MNRPWMKWYPADWRADPRLRMCSLAARGLWADLLSYMHEGTPYGHLTIDGTQPDMQGIASLVGRPLNEVKKALAELESRQVFSRDPAGAIYSRRMVRDKAKSEQDAANGKGGGNPKLIGADKGGVNPPVNGGDKAHMLEARNQKLESKEEENKKDCAKARVPADFAFAGNVVRLNTKDFEAWTKAFVNLDLLAELTARDAWLASDSATDTDRKNWFHSTSKYLANRNMEAKAKRAPRTADERRAARDAEYAEIYRGVL